MGVNIKFSIITPVYNVEKFIDQCVLSVLDQTYGNFELILVDDGSKDNSGIICDFYASKHEKVKAYHKSNSGQLHTREYGIARATGDYYVFLDSDDYLQSNALQIIYDAIISYDADCVFYGLQRICNGVVTDISTEDSDVPIEIVDKRILYKKIFFDLAYNSLCRKAVRAKMVTDVDYSKFYHIRHGEDLIQSIEILNGVSKAVFIPDVLYNYRMNPESVTHRVGYENFTVNFQVREYVLDFLKKTKIFTDEDYSVYRGYAIRLIIDQIIIISGFDTSFSNKKCLFEKILRSSYYKDFLNKDKYDRKVVGKKEPVFLLFRNKQFRIIVTIVKIVRMVQSLLCRVKSKSVWRKYGN